MNNCHGCPVEIAQWLQSARQLSDEDRRTIDRGWDSVSSQVSLTLKFNIRFEYVPGVSHGATTGGCNSVFHSSLSQAHLVVNEVS